MGLAVIWQLREKNEKEGPHTAAAAAVVVGTSRRVAHRRKATGFNCGGINLNLM